MITLDKEAMTEYGAGMHIVQPSEGDITIEEAAKIGRCSTKTLRRAVGDGRLPRAYMMTARGPQLVFQRDDLDRWLATRTRRPRRAALPDRHSQADMAPRWAAVLETVSALQTTLESSRRAIDQLTALLEQRTRPPTGARTAIARLNGSLTELEQQIQGQSPPVDEAPTRPPTSRPTAP